MRVELWFFPCLNTPTFGKDSNWPLTPRCYRPIHSSKFSTLWRGGSIIGRVCPTNSTDAQFNWDLRNLEAKSTPQAWFLCSSNLFLNKVVLWQSVLLYWKKPQHPGISYSMHSRPFLHWSSSDTLTSSEIWATVAINVFFLQRHWK